jgi:hypothetical protein
MVTVMVTVIVTVMVMMVSDERVNVVVQLL